MLHFRAFKGLGWENFADARYGDDTGDMLHSGPPGEAQHTMEELSNTIGLRPVWVGRNDKAQIVRNSVAPWFAFAFERRRARKPGFALLTC